MDNYAFKLNEDLVTWAYNISEDVELVDSEEAENWRIRYPQEATRRKPFVGIGATICGDCYWAGPGLSKEAQYICDLYSAGTYCTTEMEDYATATVLRQFGYLDHYLSERWASDFDQAPPGMSTREGLSHFEGFFPGGINVFRVGLAVVDYIVEHWDVWKYGVPPPP